MACSGSLARRPPADEQVVVTGRERLDDRALERCDRPVDERQPRLSGVPLGAAEALATGLHRRAREAVGQRLLVFGQDVDGIAARGTHDRGQEAAPIERDHDQRRIERHRAQRVDRDANGCSPSSAVTTVTPVTKWPITRRNVSDGIVSR